MALSRFSSQKSMQKPKCTQMVCNITSSSLKYAPCPGGDGPRWCSCRVDPTAFTTSRTPAHVFATAIEHDRDENFIFKYMTRFVEAARPFTVPSLHHTLDLCCDAKVPWAALVVALFTCGVSPVRLSANCPGGLIRVVHDVQRRRRPSIHDSKDLRVDDATQETQRPFRRSQRLDDG